MRDDDYIRSIILKNFRIYSNYSVELNSGVNIVVGPNASGKTSLLESIYVLSTGKSFKDKDIDLIKHGKKQAKIEFQKNGNKRYIKYFINDEKTEKEINSGIEQALREYNEELTNT